MTVAHPDAGPSRVVVRVPERGWLGGVCAGLGEALGVSPLVLRAAFVLLACWRLTGVVAYFLLWLIVPLRADTVDAPGLDAHTRAGLRTTAPAASAAPRVEWGPASALALLGAGLLWLVEMLGWGLPLDQLAVALLASGGLAAVWYQADHVSPRDIRASSGPWEWLAPLWAHWTTALMLSLGVAAVGGAVVATALLLPFGPGAVVGRSLAALALAIVSLAALAAPWLLRVRRSLAHARELKLLSDARADMAAHLHDSVLQTLALIQKQAGDPKAVTRLARRQERELRAWLYGASVEPTTLKAALLEAVEEVEDQFPVAVELVAVGDHDLTPRLAAVVRAATEAIRNAAKHAGVASVDVFAEVEGDHVEVFVRDRGRGFDLDAVPEGRLGVRQSIIGRLERYGGTARLRSDPQTGTEVTLEMDA